MDSQSAKRKRSPSEAIPARPVQHGPPLTPSKSEIASLPHTVTRRRTDRQDFNDHNHRHCGWWRALLMSARSLDPIGF